MSDTLVLRSRRVILPDEQRPATVFVADGRIVQVGGYDVPIDPTTHIDLGDLVLLPGLVDTHVHINEPGRTEWEGFATATASGAAGGVTTIVDMPLNSIPPTIDMAALDAKRRCAEGQCHVDVGFWGGVVPGNAGDLSALHDAGVFGFKCFLVDSGVPEFAPVTPGQLAEAMTTVDALFVVHAEAASELRTAQCSPQYQRFLDSRPASAEARAVGWVLAATDAAAAARSPSRSRVHVLHLSDGDATLRLLSAARRRGVPVTAETCPHYLTLTAAEVPAGATQFKCCPPIRVGSNRDLLWRGLADGVIDCVVTDHSPCPPALKRLGEGDFAAAWGGIASLQLGLAVTWTEARARGFALADVVRWMSTRPADLVGLTRKGRIAVGADADLVAFDPDEEFTVAPTRLRHRHAITPYAGRQLRGVVKRTWLRGAIVDGVTPHGRLLTREAP